MGRELLHEALHLEDLLHEEPEDVKLAVPVQIEPHNAMSYFYYVANEGRPANSNWFEYRPFRMKCERGGILRSDDERTLFEAIADHIHTNQGDKILPCAVFAESQRDDMNMRAVLIPEQQFPVGVNML
ncbi:MAG: hypothetical protein ACI8P0_006039 [Planctomycetaceae bacterium]|jgi:hypothetical protein